jgi:hypothetical protein
MLSLVTGWKVKGEGSVDEKWEYLTKFIWASIENEGAKEYVQQRWPGWQPAKYSPETMIPELNSYGNIGWELVHMQPVGAVGKNRDVGFVAGQGMPLWSNAYFCVFKRRKS